MITDIINPQRFDNNRLRKHFVKRKFHKACPGNESGVPPARNGGLTALATAQLRTQRAWHYKTKKYLKLLSAMKQLINFLPLISVAFSSSSILLQPTGEPEFCT
jgi:hypothetical protein